MLMECATLTISLIAVTFIGCNILYLFPGKGLKLNIAETVAVSFGLGFGFVSLEMLLFYFLGFGFTVDGILAPWLLIVAVNLVKYLKERKSLHRDALIMQPSSKPGLLDMFLVGGISLEIIYAIFRALIKPIESYDAIAIYAIRSKIFYLAKAIPADYFAAIARLFPHADYPLNIQLSETFLYMSMGSLNDQLVKIIFPLFFAAILCMFYFAIRRFASRTYALIFTFILASVPHFNNYAANAYLEMPLTFYVFISGLFLLRWIEDNRAIGALVISAVAAGLAGWTKNEGMMYCAIYSVLVFVFVASKGRKVERKEILYAFMYSGIIFLICLPWAWAKVRWHISNDEIALTNLNPAYLVRQFHKLGPIAYEFQKQLFGPKKWNILWPVTIIVLLLNYKRALAMPGRYVLAIIALALGGYVIFYMISYVDVVFFASKTWARFMLDFLPLAVYLLAVILKEDIKC
jgi:hypothetical protein